MSGQTKSTSDLISGIKGRDADSMECFYDYYSTLLYSMISRDIPVRHEAESLLEEIFCKLANSISLYNPADRFLTWVILFTQKEIKAFISRKNERQTKIDAVILDLFFMQKKTAFAYTAS